LPPLPCSSSPDPSVFFSDPDHGIRGIAQSSAYIYWYTDTELLRRPKAGGEPEQIPGVVLSGEPVTIEGSHAVWSRSGSLFALDLDAPGAVPLRVVDAGAPRAWAVSGDLIYYLSGDTEFDLQLEAVPVAGGSTEVLAEHRAADDLLAADSSGVYWHERDANADSTTPGYTGSIVRYDVSSATVTSWVPTVGDVRFLQTAGGRVLWVDRNWASSSAAEGETRNYSSGGESLRALGSDGNCAVWTTRIVGASSCFADIQAEPLSVPPQRTIGCGIDGVAGLVVDDEAVYYYTELGDLIGKVPRPPAD
jgi:hypothetical protein